MGFSTGASGSSSAGDGITGGYTGNSLVLRIIIASFCALAWYNALELNVLIFVTFKRYRGLYFWSLLVASWGVIPYAMGFLFKFFQIISNDFVSVTLITIGWYCMVTGQAIVLYSRLHLVLRNQKTLKRILWMIITNAVILHIPTTVLTYGSNGSLDNRTFVHGYNVMEKIQMTGFCIQEFIISGFYLWETMKILKTVNHEETRKTMYQLFYINIIIIVMDLGLLGVEYANLYILETSIKGVVYSVKLKLEFAILGRLVQYVTHQSPTAHTANVPDFVKMSRTTSDATHCPPPVKRPSKSLDARFEHVERRSSELNGDARSGHCSTKGILSKHTQPIMDLHSGVADSEDDLEKMMRKYSVRDE